MPPALSRLIPISPLGRRSREVPSPEVMVIVLFSGMDLMNDGAFFCRWESSWRRAAVTRAGGTTGGSSASLCAPPDGFHSTLPAGVLGGAWCLPSPGIWVSSSDDPIDVAAAGGEMGVMGDGFRPARPVGSALDPELDAVVPPRSRTNEAEGFVFTSRETPLGIDSGEIPPPASSTSCPSELRRRGAGTTRPLMTWVRRRSRHSSTQKAVAAPARVMNQRPSKASFAPAAAPPAPDTPSLIAIPRHTCSMRAARAAVSQEPRRESANGRA
mmetsp:Transcript_55014/g.174936  ORF Transcript_55014/g.174936 Transcript_55014/m.174936 type:complete len:270 (-) Transcript_55014:1613-2422(-)